MRFLEKIYVIVPIVLISSIVILLVLNNVIIGYLPPSVQAAYPIWPCWPRNMGELGPVPFIYDVHFLNEMPNYRTGDPIDPSLVYTTSRGIFTPNIYIKNSYNQTVWHYENVSIKGGCGVTLHYNLHDLTVPPMLNQTGWYQIFASFGDGETAFRFYVQ